MNKLLLGLLVSIFLLVMSCGNDGSTKTSELISTEKLEKIIDGLEEQGGCSWASKCNTFGTSDEVEL